jgi:glycosyltransferase involved in cell wall biosynthesis
MTDGTLAIVIPAYKADFLAAALQSIADQTTRAFTVYVGDDASPHDLESICRPFADRFRLEYTRFDRNLGGEDLVAQWTRCLALSREPWVWLFSDDDVMEPTCVAEVLARIEADAGAYDLYHFDVRQIDAAGAVTRECAPFAEVTSSLRFALERFYLRLDSFAPDYVFSREALERSGGFQRFPLAWCTDDATWIKLGRRSGIRAIRGPKVRWRLSGQNVTSFHAALAERKFGAALEYLEWLGRHLAHDPPRAGEPSVAELRGGARYWLADQARYARFSFVRRFMEMRAWKRRNPAWGASANEHGRTD